MGAGCLPALLDTSAQLVILIWGPEIDGLAIAGSLREHRPELAIIMLTARSGPGDRLLGWREGADAYLGERGI